MPATTAVTDTAAMGTAQRTRGIEEQMRTLHDAVLDDLLLHDGTPLLDVGGTDRFRELATERGAAATGVDEQAVHGHGSLPHADDTFSVVTVFDAFRFCGNGCRVALEAGRVARSGAPVVLATWGRPERCEATAYLRAMAALLPSAAAPDPFALSDDGALEAFALGGRLTPIERREVPCDWVFPDEASALRVLASTDVAVEAARAAGDSAVVGGIRHAIEPYATRDGGYGLENTFTYLVARA